MGEKYTQARNVPLIKDDINEMRKRIASYLEEIEKFDSAQNDVAEKDAKIFSALALRAYDLYEQTKIENGKLDFTDLERKTKEILSSPVGEEIRNSLTHIFIDEYQDINPLQESIINLAGKDNLFFVGDIKQSIYAFRNCSPSAFAEKRDTLGSSNVVELNRNYRSKTGILTFVNQLFSRIMSENFGMVDYAQTSRFYTEGDANDNSVEIILTNKPKRNSGKADFNTYYSMIGAENEEESGSAELEAISVVESIIKFLAENKDYSYKDVVVLTRSRGSVASAVERNLRKVGIPVSVGREVNVSEGKVNSLLLSYLRLIDNFRDDVSLIAVMRSNIGGFSDAELVKMRATHEKDLPFYEIVKKESETNEKVNEFLSELNEYVSLSQVMPLSALAGRITADKKLFFTAMSDDMGLIKADALGQLMENISEFRGTLSEYLEYLEEASPKVKVSAQAGSVRIMTIHASKGLEFPAVFLCGLNTKFKTSASKSIVCDSEFGLAMPSRISATEKATPSIPLLIARHKQKKSELEEEMRVLYVALTRAKEKLFLFLADNNYKDKLLEDCNCYAEWIYPTAVAHGIKRPSEPEESEEEQSTPPTIKDETVNGMKELLEYDYSGNAYDLKKSVTAVITEETEGLEMKYTPLLPDYEEAEGGKRLDKDEAMARGTFLHACLENMDFDRPITEQMHVFRAMDGYSDDMERALCTAHEKISALAHNRRTRKEQPFIIKSEGIEGVNDGALVQGVIDLLIIDGNEAEIIDYKSGSINEYRKVKYSKQLDIYATATQKILGLKVIKTSVYMIDEGRLIDRRNLS